MVDRINKQFGNYRLIRLLGQGGFAEVYLGEHIHLGTQAALKVLHRLSEEDVDTFRTEARTVAHLIHPHIVRVLEFGIEGKLPYLVMDYLSNGTLREHHPRGRAIPLETVVSYVKQIAEALQYAHDQKIIHRDLKPENILIGKNDELVLSDFGISIPAHGFHSLTPQIALGTPLYMAPEHFQKQAILASDQYSLGVIVYEWLCGQVPFTGQPAQLMYKHINIYPSSLCEKIPAISPTVNQVVMKTLEKDPANRFPTIQAFALALEDVLVSHIPATIPAKPATPTPPPLGNFPVGVQPVAPAPLRGVPSPQYPSSPQPFPGIRPTIPVQPITPQPVPPTLPVPGNYPGNSVQPVPSPPHSPLPQSFLDQIARFVSEKRLAAWIGFIILSLTFGGLLPLIAYVHNANTYLISTHWPFFIIWGPGETYVPDAFFESNIHIMAPYTVIFGAIGAAGIGYLFLLLKKRQPFLNIVGGIALSIAAFACFTFSWYVNPSLTYLNFYRFYENSLTGVVTGSFYCFANEFIFIALFSLWSFIGTRYFLRSANTLGRLLFGMLLITIFIVNTIFIAIYTHYFLSISNWADWLNLNMFLWITFLPLGADSLRALICGTIAIRMALRNRKNHAAP